MLTEEISRGFEEIMKDYFFNLPGLHHHARAGRLTREAARVWLCHFHHFASTFPRWLANVAGACPHLEVRPMLIRNMWDEEVSDSRVGESHVELLFKMGKGVGLTKEEILATPPLPTTTIALGMWENLTRNRPWLEGLATLQILERCNDDDLARKFGLPPQLALDAWLKLGLIQDDLVFYSVHTEADKVHAGGEAMYLYKFAKTEADRDRILQVSRESLQAMRLYQDGIYQAIPEDDRKIMEGGQAH
jgi:pyrroloquinoline quinone (PQQ) biosynthesis protein C